MPGDDYLKGYLSIHAKKSIASISLDSPFKYVTTVGEFGLRTQNLLIDKSCFLGNFYSTVFNPTPPSTVKTELAHLNSH